MKVRHGFVSNSSSSSFVVCLKPGKKSAEERLGELLEIPIKHPLSSIVDEIASTIIGCCRDTYESLEDYSIRKAAEGYTLKELDKDVLALLKEGWTVMEGQFYSDGDSPLEAMLCDMDLNVASSSIAIKHDGGY